MSEAPTIIATLRGCMAYRGAVKAVSKLVRGEGVIIDREPHNPYDSNAILVRDVDSQILGHLDFQSAAILAPWIDKGVIYLATVNSWPQVKRTPNYLGVKKGSVTIKCVPLPPLLKELEDEQYRSEQDLG